MAHMGPVTAAKVLAASPRYMFKYRAVRVVLFYEGLGGVGRLTTTYWGAPQAQCARSATIWASGRTRDPYFEILGAPRGIMVTPSIDFDF